jgi:hypothetical protein
MGFVLELGRAYELAKLRGIFRANCVGMVWGKYEILMLE